MHNIELINLRIITDSSTGRLTPIEGTRDIPFGIKRVYYLTHVGIGDRRGFHSHRKLKQVLICLNGSVKILVKTPLYEDVIELNDPGVGLFIGPMIWREMYDFSTGAVLLILASDYYDESEYIREYLRYEKEYFEYVNGEFK